MKAFLFFLLLISPWYTGMASSETSIPELKQQLESARDTMRVILLNKMSRAYRWTNADSSLHYGQRAVAEARACRRKDLEADALNNQCQAAAMLGRVDRAAACADSSLALARQSGIPSMVFNALGSRLLVLGLKGQRDSQLACIEVRTAIAQRLGDRRRLSIAKAEAGAYYETGDDHVKSADMYLEALKLQEELGNAKDIACTRHNLGNVFFAMGQNQKALENYQASLALYRGTEDLRNTAAVLNSVGKAHIEAGQYPEAAKNLEEALSLANRVGEKLTATTVLGNLGVVHERRGDFRKALDCHRRQMESWREIGNPEGQNTALLNMGKCLLMSGDFDGAAAVIKRSLAEARRLGNSEQEWMNLANLADVERKRGRFKQAMEYYLLSDSLKNIVISQQARDKIAELEMRYQADKKQGEIEALQKDNRITKLEVSRQRMLVALLAAVLALLGTTAALFYRRFRHLLAFWKRKTHIGHYRIVGRLGIGGMGVVYKAEHLLDRTRPVALKVIREELAGDPVLRKRFLHEAAVVDQLDHPNIVKIFERGEFQGVLFIAMELLEGRSLVDLISRTPPPALELCCSIMGQLADGVNAIHNRGIVHRDLKPENVMLVTDGGREVVKLLDFGLARDQTLSQMTMTGEILGTVHYLAPERADGQESTAASDVFSLGVIFYELVTGRKPFVGETPLDVVRQITGSAPSGPGRLRADLPDAVDGLIVRMLQKDPRQRPSSGEVVGILEGCREGGG